MPDHAVEIHGGCGPCKGDEVVHLGNPHKVALKNPDSAIRGLEGRPFGHIQDNLKLVLVVKG